MVQSQCALEADWLPDHTILLTLDPRMVCTACGLIGADVRPDWSQHTNAPQAGGAHAAADRLLLITETSSMAYLQWAVTAVTAGTAIFVALVAYFQWRTAENKTVLDLFEERYAIYDAVRKAVAHMLRDLNGFGPQDEQTFLTAKHRAYFYFGDDVEQYLEQLWHDILNGKAADSQLSASPNQEHARIVGQRWTAFRGIEQFYKVGQPLFGRYMRFSHRVR